MTDIRSSLTLPCGAVLKNRLVKAAMTERIADKHHNPTAAHSTLYRHWANSGAGLLITGNVIIDRDHLESAGNICFDAESSIPKLKAWASSCIANDTHAWVQISHAGRQTNRFTNRHPLAPSAVHLKRQGLFGTPRPMSEQDILSAIDGFVLAAQLAQRTGFTGVQFHSAHGYLLSQFLSKVTNKRTDKWGGTLENRYRLLQTIVRRAREAVGPTFPISVKLNSSDFQKGGFTQEESLTVIGMLDQEGIDLLEISGGTYENVVFFMMNEDTDSSTHKREAYFIDFATQVRKVASVPLLITGGFRSFDFCNKVLSHGELDLIGMARPFITNLDDIPRFLTGALPELKNLIVRSGIKQFEDGAEGGYYARQIIRLSQGKAVDPRLRPLLSTLFLVWHELTMSMR